LHPLVFVFIFIAFGVFGRFVTRGAGEFKAQKQKRDKKITEFFRQPPEKVLTYLRHFFFTPLLNPRPTNPPSDFPPPPTCFFFKYVFERFSVRGVQKHHNNVFTKKSMSKTFSKTIDKTFDVSSFLDFFLSCFRVFLSDWSSKTLQKNVLQKKSIEKLFTTKATKNPKPIFLRFILIKFLGVSL
jgi:hypothetical protein